MENPGLTLLEQCAQFSLWAEMAAPLLISADVARLSRAAFAILSNSAVVALDQDPLGMEATRIKEEAGVDILSRPLANGDRAVVFRSTAVFRVNNFSWYPVHPHTCGEPFILDGAPS